MKKNKWVNAKGTENRNSSRTATFLSLMIPIIRMATLGGNFCRIYWIGSLIHESMLRVWTDKTQRVLLMILLILSIVFNVFALLFWFSRGSETFPVRDPPSREYNGQCTLRPTGNQGGQIHRLNRRVCVYTTMCCFQMQINTFWISPVDNWSVMQVWNTYIHDLQVNSPCGCNSHEPGGAAAVGLPAPGGPSSTLLAHCPWPRQPD